MITQTAVVLGFLLLAAGTATHAAPRERILFNAGWRFHLDEPTVVETGATITGWRWHSADSGAATGSPPEPGDGKWASVNPGQDVFSGRPGTAWYRAVLPAAPAKDRLAAFASVDDTATVFLNGRELARHEGWDEPFEAPLDGAWTADGENVLLVLVQNAAGPGGMGPVRLVNRAHEGNPACVYPSFDDTSWETVNLPHYGRIEAYDVSRHWQGICWYRKVLAPIETMKGRLVSLEFEGAMQLADVWVNGEHRLTHSGGYLPFTLDLTADCASGRPVAIAVRLDNRDHGDILPGKPLAGLDFGYFSGIYRNVVLHISDRLRITDAVAENKVAGGGIFVSYPEVSRESAMVQMQVHVRNGGPGDKVARIACALFDGDDHEAGEVVSETASIPSASDHTFLVKMNVPHPRLWHPDHPNLYRLRVRVLDGDRTADEQAIRIGIRRVAVDPVKGFLINGEPLMLSGTNRHQQYPWVGNAISDNCQYRDARKLKEAGFNYLRLCHYPQSPAMMDACDELGLIAIVCVPGWQWYRGDKTFQANLAQAEQDMVRWHRNHPSAVLWEVSLNESGMPDDVLLAMNKLVHAEYPGDQMLTCGDTHGGDTPAMLAYEVPYTGWDQERFTRPANVSGRKGLHREYGDYEFGGNESTSRAFRGDGEGALLLSAWNYQWSCNKNLGYPWTIGQSTWVGIDYNRGCCPTICACGLLDEVRLTRFSYEFYRSQRDPGHLRKDIESGPTVFIANYWMQRSSRKVVVYSNCDEVELLLNGVSLGRRKPDSGPDTPYGGPPTTFDGGNCRNLAHPPFTFQAVNFQPGELKAVGYIGGKPVRAMVRRTPGEPSQLRVWADTAGRDLAADGADAVFVHAEVRDAAGTLVPGAAVTVKFSVEGDGTIIGENPRAAEAGVASVLLRAGTKPGRLKVTAVVEGLPDATAVIMLGRPCPG